MASSNAFTSYGNEIPGTMACGVITAGSTASAVTIALGFVPRRVVVKGLVNLLEWEWVAGMNAGDYFVRAAAGDRTLATDDKLLVNSDGTIVITPVTNSVLDDNDGCIWYAER